MLSFFEDVDKNFNLEELDESRVSEIREFITKRAGKNLNDSIIHDGELTREISSTLQQHLLRGNGTVQDMPGLLQDISNLKALYSIDAVRDAGDLAEQGTTVASAYNAS